jgi:hypothetical protein
MRPDTPRENPCGHQSQGPDLHPVSLGFVTIEIGGITSLPFFLINSTTVYPQNLNSGLDLMQ